MSIMTFGKNSFIAVKGLKERVIEAERKELQMRKYRGLTKEGKLVYGWFLKTHNPTTEDTYWIIKDGLYATDIIIGIDNTKFPKMLQGCYPVIPETVGQFTGLKDKNGTEIYEGDLMPLKHSFEHTKHIGKVTFKSKDGYGIFLDDDRPGYGYVWFPFSKMDKDEFEVIGNIHQNPELLEQDNG